MNLNSVFNDDSLTSDKLTVAHESNDKNCNIVFTTDTPGDFAPKTSSKLIFDSASGTLSASYLHVTKSLSVGTLALTETVGEIRASNDITAFYSSDNRLKENIIKIQEPLSKLEKINGYTFDWIKKEGIHSHEGSDIGVIAQEIEKVMPEITTTRDNGYKAVKYEKIIPLLIESIKEQQKQIEEFRNEIELLKNNK